MFQSPADLKSSLPFTGVLFLKLIELSHTEDNPSNTIQETLTFSRGLEQVNKLIIVNVIKSGNVCGQGYPEAKLKNRRI